MAVTRDIYVNFTEQKLVKSSRENTVVRFPAPYHQDNLSLVIHPLEIDTSRTPNQGPFAEISGTGLSLVVKIFASDGTTVLASQTSFTASGNTLVGTLDLNTGAMATAIASGDITNAILEFEFEYTDGSTLTVQQRDFIIYEEFIIAGSPVAIPNETYLTENASLSLFVKKVGAAGEGFYLTSPDGTKTIYCYVDNNGVLKTDLVS